jgi:hypothetical protein
MEGKRNKTEPKIEIHLEQYTTQKKYPYLLLETNQNEYNTLSIKLK